MTRTTEPLLPVCIMASPTVYDVLRERIMQDPKIAPQDRMAIYLRSSEIIRERGLTQI